MSYLERDKYGRWRPSGIWIVTLERDGTWHCSEGYTRESAETTASLMMMKHPVKRDMSRAKIVFPLGYLGLPYLSAPEYIDYSEMRKTPVEVWVVEAPTRYQAIKIARSGWEARQLPEE